MSQSNDKKKILIADSSSLVISILKNILEKEGFAVLAANDGNTALELIKTELLQKEGELRLVPVNIQDSNYIIQTDYVVMALGSEPEEFVSTLGLDTNKWGNIKINDKYQTSNSKIYAGGDLAGVRGTVAWAAYSGRQAAKNIIEAILK